MKTIEKELPYACSLTLLEIFHLSFSIKFQKEDEWMIDPVTIADTYGPEVSHFLFRINEFFQYK